MTTTLSLPRVATALREPALDTLRLATCPLCHAKRVASTQEPLETDEDWRCARCGQRWDAPRLAAVAAYAEGVARRESARDVLAASHDTGRLAHVAPKNRPVEAGEAISRWDAEGGAVESARSRPT